MTQQGDVLLFNTTDGGEITVRGGVTEMSGGLEGSVYLALFGGNFDDDGTPGNPLQYWGNYTEPDVAGHYRSQTQHLLQSLPATSGNLARINQAVLNDCNYLIESGAASSVEVVSSLPEHNAVDIVVTVIADGEAIDFKFSANWTVPS